MKLRTRAPHTLTSNGREYDVYTIIEESAHIKAQPLLLSSFEKEMIAEACWTDSTGEPLSPQDLITAYMQQKVWGDVMKKHPSWQEHITKTQQSDYSFPILYYQGEIIDGMHRFVKAVTNGQEYILVRELSELPEAASLP